MSMKIDFDFCGLPIGEGHPPVIVAEIGFNHNGDVGLARQMIESAAFNSADAVKLQVFIGEELVSKRYLVDDPDHPGNEIPMYEFFKRYELKRKDYKELFDYARRLGIPLFATPFDEASLDMLVELGMPAVKVASPDLTHFPLLKRMARVGLPIVLSTGTGTEEEVDRALKTIRGERNENIIILHCVSNYPSRHEEMNLLCLPALQSRFKIPVGLSDHTMDSLSATVASTLGAVMIEKHFTLDRSLPGVDQGISMEPKDLRELKSATREVWKVLGVGKKTPQPSEDAVRKLGRRSLVARSDIEAGTTITREMLSVKRPGTGIPPEYLDRAVGRTARIRIRAEELITWEMI